jgi:DNA-binding NarL/FixJ family response regulator
MSTRVLVADDAPLIREALAGALQAAGLEVVGQVGTPAALLAAAARLSPDVAIVDIRMPPTYRLEGLQAAVKLRVEQPAVGVLLLSQHVQPEYLHQLVATGPSRTGYLLKERAAGVVSFVQAVRTVAAGGCCFDPQIVSAMVGSARAGGVVESLSPRERQVLQLMAEGWSNSAICERCGLGEKTVESHIRRIFQRLEIPDEPDRNRRVTAVLAYLRAAGNAG